jgi:hypothetical protein
MKSLLIYYFVQVLNLFLLSDRFYCSYYLVLTIKETDRFYCSYYLVLTIKEREEKKLKEGEI